MNNLFRKEYEQANDLLFKKGYYVNNMIYFNDEYEISDEEDNILIDHLSLAQLICLSKML